MKRFIDVSHWNVITDWNKIKADRIDGVFIKTSQAVGLEDSKAVEHSNGAKAAGLPIGYYHFATMTHSGQMEADYFIQVIKQLNPPSLPIVLDIEANKTTPTFIMKTKDEVLKFIKDFFAELERQGYHDYILYSDAGFLNSNLPEDHGLGNIRLWHSEFTNRATPKLPIGWSIENVFAWQYTNKATEIGIEGVADESKTLK